MPQNSRYSVEEKDSLVCGYMDGLLSSNEFESTYEVNQRLLRDWVRLYKVCGA